jgi:hypothetical protein
MSNVHMTAGAVPHIDRYGSVVRHAMIRERRGELRTSGPVLPFIRIRRRTTCGPCIPCLAIHRGDNGRAVDGRTKWLRDANANVVGRGGNEGCYAVEGRANQLEIARIRNGQ